jgi:hypothetical protein
MTAHFDGEGRFLHRCCKCGVHASFGYGVNLRADKLGTWFCGDHRPNQNRHNQPDHSRNNQPDYSRNNQPDHSPGTNQIKTNSRWPDMPVSQASGYAI